MKLPAPLAAYLTLLLLPAATLAQGTDPASAAVPIGPPMDGPVLELPFPYVATAAWGERGLHLVPDPIALDALADQFFVRFVDVPVPGVDGIELVDLELRRVRIATPAAELRVNGELVGGRAELEAGFTAWSGTVAGEEDSDAFFAFARTGARGWIQRAGAVTHLNPLDATGKVSGLPEAVLLHESDPSMSAIDYRFDCEVREAGDAVVEERGGDQRSSVLLQAEIAVETDYQYFQVWNNLQSAQDYALSLWSAISIRYEDKVNCRIALPYLGLYDNANDPWTAQGGGAGAMLDEFRIAWGGNIPANADLAHFMSGAGLGGGVAYVDTLCNQYWGFAVSGNISGQVQFPVPTSAWFTWDFMVCAHEAGHNFGSWHTHDYCPPLDECAAGACTSGGDCSKKGTIMSYCHGCPGGMVNILTYFHDTSAALMASRAAAAGCIDRAPCALCNCYEPHVTTVFPGTVRSYDPDGELVTLLGCNFADVSSVTADGTVVGSGDISLGNDSLMSFRFPRVSQLGDVDVFATNAAGNGAPFSMTVVPPATPRLGVLWYQGAEPGVSKGVGLPLVVGGTPGDVVLLCYSSSPTPSTLPGLVDLDIGAGFTDLYLFWTLTMGAKGWEAPSFSLAGAPVFSSWYVQGGVLLSSTGMVPLASTDMRGFTVVW